MPTRRRWSWGPSSIALFVWISALSGWLGVGGLTAQTRPVQTGSTGLPQNSNGQTPIDFNWDIRPILSENCFRCHGPDAGNRRANLRLDTRDSAYAERRAGAHAVVPGNPDASEVIKRITQSNAALRMPPATTNKVLSEREIEALRRWIVEGAAYKPHWSFIAPALPTPPPVRDARRLYTPIDHFIVNRLEREGLMLSPPADKETLINRVYLTLTGLPPTPEEVDAFLHDVKPGAYEAVVDRLLASPAYAEHAAQSWLNVGRFAETDGFLGDEANRLFWPYRDWVISAMRRNMPFNEFATWQLAGDLLPNASKDQKLATAFLRVGKRSNEGGIIDEEYRAEYMMDRAVLVGAGFMGLTVGCARCHDHKYDPIPQKDFYSLGAFFNSIDEPGKYDFAETGVTGGPTLLWTDAGTERKLQRLREAVQARESARDASLAAARRKVVQQAREIAAEPGRAAEFVREALAKGLQAYYPFDETAPIPDEQLPTALTSRRISPPMVYPELMPGADTGKQRAAGATPANPPRLLAGLTREDLVFAPAGGSAPPAVLMAPDLRDGVKGKAVFNTDTSIGFLGRDIGMFERTQPFSIDFWLQPATVYDEASVLMHRDSDLPGSTGYTLDLEKNHLVFEIRHTKAGDGIRVVSRDVIPPGGWTHATVTYDGSSRARGIAIYLGGAPAGVDITRDSLSRTIIPNAGGGVGDFLGLQFGNRYHVPGMKGGGLDEIRIFSKVLNQGEVRYLDDSTTGTPVHPPSAEEIAGLMASADPLVKAAEAALLEARNAENALVSAQPEVMVFGDMPTPRPAYVLVRGLYSEHGEPVSPKGIDAVLPWSEAWPKNRLGLAQWLFDEKNPLTARVFVNRVWQMHFGRGLVETSEDFGSQGSIPVNPQLLDYLAVSFRTSGWDIKKLHKTIVMSATYQQASVSTAAMNAKDPRDLLLARYPRVRMPAELVRDNALVASGLLVRSVGGPSVFPYQPAGIWDGIGTGQSKYPDEHTVPADEQHRRSMYSFVKRNAPHPAMAVFDLPDGGGPSVRRNVSNTPLQALVLLNDPQYLESYRALATHVLKTEGSPQRQIALAFRLATRRLPRGDEQAALLSYYTEELTAYEHDLDGARALTSVGVTPPDGSLDRARLAAFTNVVTTIMNTPDAYTLR